MKGIVVKFTEFVKYSIILKELESDLGKIPEDYQFDLAKYTVSDLYGKEMLMCSLIKLPLLLKQLKAKDKTRKALITGNPLIDFSLYSESDIIGFLIIARFLDMDAILLFFLRELEEKKVYKTLKIFELLHVAGREDGLFKQLIYQLNITMLKIYSDDLFDKVDQELIFRLYRLMPSKSFKFVRIHLIPTKEFVPQTYWRGRSRQAFAIGKSHPTTVMKEYYQEVSWDKDCKVQLSDMKPKDSWFQSCMRKQIGDYTLLCEPPYYPPARGN